MHPWCQKLVVAGASYTGMNQMLKQQRLLLTSVILAFLMSGWGQAGSPLDNQASTKLMASRDALLSEERDIQRAYDEVARQIDELQRKQALLDSYLRQVHGAIRDVDRAMGQ